jgi:hypothetical protein
MICLRKVTPPPRSKSASASKLAEAGFQPRKALGGGFGAREFLTVQRYAAVLVIDGHHRLGEAVLLDRTVCALLTDQRERIDGFAGDAFLGGNRVAAHALVRLRVDFVERGVARAHAERLQTGIGFLGADLRGVAHHFGTAGDDAILHARHHRRGGEVDAADAAAAETVERGARGLGVITRRERRHATEVAALLALLRRGRPDDIVDRRGVEMVALLDRLQHRRGKMLRVEVRERALAGLADAARGADGVDDIGFRHDWVPFRGD